MKNIFILGAGVMGSALAVPAAERAENRVTLVGSPLDDGLVESVQQSRMHPTLRTSIPPTINAVKLNELDTKALALADVIIIGVSSPGIDWVVRLLDEANAQPALLGLVTKGLVENPDVAAPPLTYADYLLDALPGSGERLVGIGGPCIARELALCIPTRVTFASRNIHHAATLRSLLQTPYYRVTTHSNIVAVEACAALKNFLCIGVSAMISAHPLDEGHARNPVAALYNQAVLELLILSRWISAYGAASRATRSEASGISKTRESRESRESREASDASEKRDGRETREVGDVVSHQSVLSLSDADEGCQKSSDVAFDLAGMGDLHVTVGGGRNSRLGTYIGSGRRLQDVIQTDMAGITVEGVDTGRRLLPGFRAACRSGTLTAGSLPLTAAILQCIETDEAFDFNFTDLPG
jgi:glycerol-3-phosphate dehydrogenase (NAD(P)+)